jgi:hypothetical protein
VQQGNYKDACPKFEASYKREEALGTLMNLADCHEKTNALSRAWSEWGAAYEMARKASDAGRADFTKRRQDAIEPRLPKLKITVKGGGEGLVVWLDERVLDSLEYDVELPVDPGKHVIRVRRDKETFATEERETAEAAHQSVTIDLSAIAAMHPAPVAKEKPLGVTAPPPSAKKRPWQTVLAPWVIGGGGAAVVAGVAFELTAIGIKGNHECASESGQKTVCSQAGLDKIDNARSFAITGEILLFVGGGVMAGGVLLWLLAPKQSTTQAAVVPLPGGAALTWGGTF